MINDRVNKRYLLALRGWSRLVMAGALSMAAVACSQEDSGDKPAAASEPAAAEPATGSAATSGAEQEQAATPPAPKAMANTPTPGDALGTLPPDTGLPVGTKVPDATVRDAEGAEVSLASLYAKGPVMVVFYRGGWCPYCNSQVRKLTQAAGELEARGVTPVLISVDQIAEANKTKRSYEIPFPLLSDPELAAHKAFRVLNEVSGEDYQRLKGFGVDLEKASGQTHHTIAVPSIFVIDTSGVIRWAHADRDYKVRPQTEALLAVLDKLALGKGE